MARFSIRFLGCKVSQTDAQAVRERLLADGHLESRDADIAVVNTCCVTHEAVRKSRQAVARLGDEVTVKRLRRRGHAVTLEAENPDFAPIEVDLRREALAIEGVAVGVIRNGKTF